VLPAVGGEDDETGIVGGTELGGPLIPDVAADTEVATGETGLTYYVATGAATVAG